MKKMVLTILTILFVIYLLNPAIIPWLNNEKNFYLLDAMAGENNLGLRTTTGPDPPPGREEGVIPSRYQTIIQGVPPYLWRHGCSPTSGGMVMGYYDSHGYPDLLNGTADTQTPQVNDDIASLGNWFDYCLPLDEPPGPIQPDLSEPPFDDQHPNNCIADFMLTSQSFYDLYYGATPIYNMGIGIQQYATWKNPQYSVTQSVLPWGTLTWSNYCAEINANRPVIFIVDSDGDGSLDHAVPGIGYDSSNHYACYDTWETSIQWYDFVHFAPGNIFGVWGATFLTFSGGIPVLGYSPPSFNFGDVPQGNIYGTSFHIWNAGADTLNWMLTDKNPWLTYNPASGSSAGEMDLVNVFIDTTGLSPGPYTGSVNISSNGGSNNFTVTFNVIVYTPQLAYYPSSHDFGVLPEGQTSSTEFEIWNAETGTLQWNASSSQPWLSIVPSSGTSAGEHTTVTVTINTTGLSVGDYMGAIELASNGGTGTFQVTCTIQPMLTYNYPVYTGWNLITVPIQNSWTAETLGQSIPGCTLVIMFNVSTQTFITHVVGVPWDDFSIVDGVGYFVYCTQDGILNLPDLSIPNVNVTLHEDWNLIGWYHEYTATAESLGDSISGSSVVIVFDAETQTFLTHVVNTPWDNFTIERGMGVFVYTTETSIWHGEG